MNGPSWRKLGLLVLIIAVVAVVLELVGFDLSMMTPERMQEFVRSFGAWAPAAYLVIYIQPIVPLPAMAMLVVAGSLFGPVFGIIGALGGTIGRACSQFALARSFGRKFVSRFLHGRAAKIDENIGRRGFLTVILIRIASGLPFDVQNYSLGCSQVRFGPYFLASIVGVLPWVVSFAYLGHSLTDFRNAWKIAFAFLLIAAFVWIRQAYVSRRKQSVVLRVTDKACSASD